MLSRGSQTYLYDGVNSCDSEKVIFIRDDPESDSEDDTPDDLN